MQIFDRIEPASKGEAMKAQTMKDETMKTEVFKGEFPRKKTKTDK